MNNRSLAILSMIVLGIVLRWLPHPPNFSPVAAVALFGGAYLSRRWLSLLLPIAVLLVSDALIGFYSLMPVVYLCFVITAMFGWTMHSNKSALKIGAYSLVSAVLFYVVTNFAVWFYEPLYSKDWAGLISCYVAAIPFFGYNVIGNLVFSGVMFGLFAFAEINFSSLREEKERI